MGIFHTRLFLHLSAARTAVEGLSCCPEGWWDCVLPWWVLLLVGHIFICSSISNCCTVPSVVRNCLCAAGSCLQLCALPASYHTDGSTWLPGGSRSPAATSLCPGGGRRPRQPGWFWRPSREAATVDVPGLSPTPRPPPHLFSGLRLRLWLKGADCCSLTSRQAVTRVLNYLVVYMLDDFRLRAC